MSGVRHITGRFVTHLPTPPDPGFIYEYQTLITGILAVLAAIAAAFIANGQLAAARAQIAEAKNQAIKDRNARLRAARATLPVTLSTICEYAAQSGTALASAWPQAATVYPNDFNEFQAFAIRPDLPTWPATVVPTLERVIEFTDDEAVADRIESILREAQVLGSRMRGLSSGETITLRFLSEMILDAAALYARAESLFGYARRQDASVTGGDLWDRTFSALSLMNIDREYIRTLGREQRAAGQAPGEADTLP